VADLPETEELVLATVKKIMPYGAFCSLDEYGGRESFLHISEVAPRWIKNIHEFLHEGQSIVAKVHNVIAEKEQVDVSIKRVSDAERKLKIESVRQEKRASKIFEVAVKQAKSTTDETQSAKKQILQKYGDLISAFDDVSTKGEAALAGMKIEKGLLKALLEVGQKSARKVKSEVRRQLLLESYSSEGVEEVKKALCSLAAPDGSELKILYLGAPRYQLTLITEKDYKEANRMLEALAKKLDEEAGKTGMHAEWGETEEGGGDAE